MVLVSVRVLLCDIQVGEERLICYCPFLVLVFPRLSCSVLHVISTNKSFSLTCLSLHCKQTKVTHLTPTMADSRSREGSFTKGC